MSIYTEGDMSQDVMKRWAMFGTADDIVSTRFEETKDVGQTALNDAKAIITDLMTLVEELNPIDTNIPFPDISTVDIAGFTGTPPTAPDSASLVPNLPTNLNDAEDLNNAVRQKLLNDIANESAAIPDAVRDAIFNRGFEREELLHQDNVDRISDEWAKRRFILPDSILAALIAQADIDFTNKRLDISRDLTIKDFELTDANMKFAVEKAIQWYGMRVETYKALVQAEIARIDAIVRNFVAQAEVYRTEAGVYTALVDTEIKKFDAEVKQAMVRADILIKNAELDMKNYEFVNTMKLEGFKAIGAVAAQVAAGAFAAVSASAHISASNSSSFSYRAPASLGEVIDIE